MVRVGTGISADSSVSGGGIGVLIITISAVACRYCRY